MPFFNSSPSIIGAEIEIANEIDTFSEVGYLYDGLYEGLTSEMVKKDRKREKARKIGIRAIAGSSEEEETQEEIERDSEFIDVVGTSQDNAMMQVEERTDEEQVMIFSNFKKTN
ncbi:hypothetical protein GCK72_025018 [Caenorhabditis remanei]|nr:hypothetical protein GCK72_025018 [Caenorhabditis remanei]KAF1748551.1 hypothetical protein GCK72_025018 [Caenorhabditis remanei]